MIKLALPAGDLRTPLAQLLSGAGLLVEGYGEGSRSYRLKMPSQDEVAVRVFREKDIPVQIALGNYDVGICSLAWVREMQARFPEQPIVALSDLGLGAVALWVATDADGPSSFAELGELPKVRIASDYPNLAEMFARAVRLPAYRIQAVWGAAEAYPPEDADAVLVAATSEEEVRQHGLRPLFCLLDSSAWVIANAAALAGEGLGPLLTPLLAASHTNGRDGQVRLPPPVPLTDRRAVRAAERPSLRMAVPDGHQQRHVVEALRAAGLEFEGYDDSNSARRPKSGIPGLDVKVIRPHDMAQLVATGELDMAITGRDCLNEHLYSFPASPVEEVLDLQRGQYNLSAVVAEDLPATTLSEALDCWRGQGRTAIRVAAEFPATADHYARSRHFWRYQIISIAGASEGFVPEDADMLIEGTETGKTIAENNLKVIDLLYRSTTCVIAHKNAQLSDERRATCEHILGKLRRAAEAQQPV